MTKNDIQKQLGQLLMMGIAEPALLPEEGKVIRDIQPAGVIYFRRNIASVPELQKLTRDIKELSGTMPLIGIDQEGGRVARLGAPFTTFPGNDFLGRAYIQTKKTNLTRQQSAAMAIELKSVGINLNFTPIADIHTNPENPIIGSRAFGLEPKIVSKLVVETVREYRKQKVVSCAKHFPGHGDSSTDSHLVLPYVDITRKTLMTREILPFAAAIRAGVPTIMTAHVVYPKIDKLPATLSKKIIEGILRKKLKFSGVLISDDMEMSAIANSMSIPEASVEAIKAGVDMLLVCKKLDLAVQVHEALVKNVENGKLPMKRVLEALHRIHRVKKAYLEKKSFEKLRFKGEHKWLKHQKLSEKIKKF